MKRPTYKFIPNERNRTKNVKHPSILY